MFTGDIILEVEGKSVDEEEHKSIVTMIHSASESVRCVTQRPFLSCFDTRHEREASYMIFIVKISFHSCANKIFDMKSFARSVDSIMTFKAIRKWPSLMKIVWSAYMYALI